jgi:putative ABC transport system substrate-binding protein
MIGRREFVTLLGGAAAAWPLVARAQQSLPVIGHITLGAQLPDRMAAFRRGLRETGYVEGQNAAIVSLSTDQNDRLPGLLEDLVRRQVRVIFAQGNYAIAAAKAATSTIPIVFSGGFDPVELGIVTSLSRPGGNITGVSFLANALEPKRLGLVRLLVPSAKTIAALINPDNASAAAQSRDLTEAARSTGLRVIILEARHERELDPAIAKALQQKADALVVATDGPFTDWREPLIGLVASSRIPAIYASREFAKSGGLISYAASSEDADYQAGIYVGRILKGEKPGDLPVILPTKFALVINLKAAKALGLTVPDGLLLAADEVIE